MSFIWLAKKIVNSKGYKFTQDHRRFIVIVEGIIIIGLLMGVWVYFYQDCQLKKQVRDRCGFEDDNWQCVCTKSAVDFYKMQQSGNFSGINFTLDSTKSLANQDVGVVG